MNEHSPFDSTPDAELGAALREALPTPFSGVFVNRVRARMRQRARNWDDELAGWFWQGLLAASLLAVLAGWGWKALAAVDESDSTASASVASQLLEGSTPGATVLLASMSSADAP